MRKLASVQEIKSLSPIEGADRIELAHVLGWQCVVKKGAFSAGDRAVYFEIDSFLPISPEFEFLRSSSYKKSDLLGEGFRLKTMKMRGEISQGLLVPLHELGISEDTLVGTDVTERLGVRKWEIAERATTGGTIIGTLPSCVPKTDETRVQNMPELIEAFRGKEYYISTKMDGSSHSLAFDGNGVHICGHNYEYKDDGKSSFYEFVKKNEFDERIKALAETLNLANLTIQGEFCAPGIQKNRLKLAEPHWYVFTVIENDERVCLAEMEKVAEAIGAEHVPIEEVGADLPEIYPEVENLLSRAEGKYPAGGNKEGVVIRTIEPERYDIDGGYLSMKVINNKYLL